MNAFRNDKITNDMDFYLTVASFCPWCLRTVNVYLQEGKKADKLICVECDHILGMKRKLQVNRN